MTELTERPAPTVQSRHVPGRRYRDGVCNQKGGAGKTTTTVSLGSELGRRELERLRRAHPDAGLAQVVAELAKQPVQAARIHDMDPQRGSATLWLPPQWNHVPKGERYDMSHVLKGECTLDQATWPTTVPGLYIVPSYQTLTGWANSNPPGGEFALREALDESELQFLSELVDAPPSLGLLTLASLTAIHRLFIPLRASGLDFAGVGELNETLSLVFKRLNADLDVAALILCGMLESKLVGQIIEQLQKDFPKAFTHEIRHTVRVGEAPFENQPLHLWKPGCTADLDYRDLTTILYGEEEKAA